MSGSTYDLTPKDNTEQKFSSRCRLYVGNFADVTEEEVTAMFKTYGEVNESYVNTEKMFAFVRLVRISQLKLNEMTTVCLMNNALMF